MEGDERDLGVDEFRMAVQAEARDARKCSDPTTLIRGCRHVELSATDEEGPSMICGGVFRVWERLLPRLEVGQGTESDIGEKVLSGAWNP